MKNLRKIIPVIAICIIGIMLTVIVKKSGHPLTVDTILEYTPDNTLLAIVVMPQAVHRECLCFRFCPHQQA